MWPRTLPVHFRQLHHYSNSHIADCSWELGHSPLESRTDENLDRRGHHPACHDRRRRHGHPLGRPSSSTVSLSFGPLSDRSTRDLTFFQPRLPIVCASDIYRIFSGKRSRNIEVCGVISEGSAGQYLRAPDNAEERTRYRPPIERMISIIRSENARD